MDEGKDPILQSGVCSKETIVRFVGVEKSYDGVSLVVRNLNFDIAKGEFLTMLGPSGSGKTTTLVMLAGFESATRGQILLKGNPITRLPPHRRNIGMVFQNYALFPHMTVRQNLAFPLEVRHLDKAEMAGRITRALEMVELAGYADRMPVQLSGGQQQRIALARALIFEPDIVLMDEPLGALDKQLRDQMQFEIKHLHERLGLTVVYVTHDQSEALTMSDRIAVFHNGEIQQLSTPAELYEHPCNSFVAHFIGENNRLPGVVEALEPGGLCRVRLRSGDLVPALRVNVKTAGDRTLLSIRPERVTLAAAGDTDCVVLEGRVLEMIFLGDHVRVRLAVAGSDDFIIKIPNAQNRRQLAPGEILRLGCRPEDLHALDGGT